MARVSPRKLRSNGFSNPLAGSLLRRFTGVALLIIILTLLLGACGANTPTLPPSVSTVEATVTPQTTATSVAGVPTGTATKVPVQPTATPVVVVTIPTVTPPPVNTPAPTDTAVAAPANTPTVESTPTLPPTLPPTSAPTETATAPTETIKPIPHDLSGKWEQVGLTGQIVKGLYGVFSDGHVMYATTRKTLERGTEDKNGQWHWSEIRRDEVGSFTVKEPNEIWYTTSGGCARGGVTALWHSADSGTTWNKLDDTQIFNSIIYYAGNLYASSCGGPMRSSDGGKTWVKLASPKLENADPVGLQVSADNAKHLYLTLTTEGGSSFVLRSDDGGGSWLDVSPKESGSGFFTFAGNKGDDVYGLSSNGFWSSTDAGKTWHKSVDGLGATKIGYGQTYLLRAFAANEDDSRLYVGSGVSVANFKGAGAFQSSDGGTSWSPLGDKTLNNYTVSDFAFMPDKAIYVATDNGIYRIIP